MIVILTAVQLEYLALRKHLTGIQTHQHPAGTLFETGVVAGQHVAIAVIGEGNMSAAALTERAITEFQPGAVLFVGIAGALRDWLVLGDVVVATRVYAYHGGRSTDDAFRTRPRVWDSSHRLEQVARFVARSDAWRSAIPTAPAVHFNPIAAGEVLLDSTTSTVADHLRDRYEDAIAIEMESAGMANAGHLNNAPTLTIRGISDFADGSKDQTGQPELAADNAAVFAVAVIAKLTEADHPVQGPRERRGSDSVVNNAAYGNAHVVAQIGTVHGDVQFNAPGNSVSAVDRLRQAVFADFQAGQLDETTLGKAMQSIDQLGDTPDPLRIKGSIQQLSELLGHRPGLAALVARLAEGGA